MAYWTDVGSSTIKRLHLNTSKEELLMNGCIADSTPDGIALDIHSRLLFYTDTGKKVIGVTSLDISYHATLISKGLDQPRAIAADPGRGYIYWSDWGLQSSIKKARMDGSGQQVVVNTGIGHWPNGLTLDAYGQVLYWCDARADSINSVDLVLLRTTVVHRKKGSHFFGITHLGDDLFFSDWTKR
ncbi:hypothetical protein CAPTEDRAFT_121310 [Capitella teleta]|uniref:DUF5050 domain-containing protein n=1 Tax=Capitella teleta TaxID=283909 RepID=R7V5M9_CAPTE|nr:hypothetical protein CAPTEDRAFT_121310 [Capitella teleta]|eukprot:ELU14158.1 hypothetical protein CAPTEDRAFT_121310 [Capitella teleta]